MRHKVGLDRGAHNTDVDHKICGHYTQYPQYIRSQLISSLEESQAAVSQPASQRSLISNRGSFAIALAFDVPTMVLSSVSTGTIGICQF